MSSEAQQEAAQRITAPCSDELRVLTAEQVEAYREHGFIAVEGLVGSAWLERLHGAMREFVEQSRSLTESTPLFDLEPDHSAARPRLRRLVSPADLHATFWEFASQSVLVDVVEDVVERVSFATWSLGRVSGNRRFVSSQTLHRETSTSNADVSAKSLASSSH